MHSKFRPKAREACLAAIAATAFATGPAGAQDGNSFSVLLSQDNFFGFYPSFNGLLDLGGDRAFSFYGIEWTTDAFGTAAGSDLWTEFGAGMAFTTMDGRLTWKPQVGITNGILLSTADTNDEGAAGGNLGDGIVPSLTVGRPVRSRVVQRLLRGLPQPG